MLLAIDIGNTNISLGCIREGALLFEARIATDRTRTADQYAVELKSMLALNRVEASDLADSIVSSVVPPVSTAVCAAVEKLMGKAPLVVSAAMETGLDICLDVPSQAGADRLVAAVAALSLAEPPLTIIDMGTATTIEVIEPGRRYMGGVIIPGVRVALDALTGRTAQLPAISLDRPGKVVATNTADCMRSGILYGAASMLDGMIDRIHAELGHGSTVIATGGLAPAVIPLCRHEIRLEPDLLLRGLGVLYEMNRK